MKKLFNITLVLLAAFLVFSCRPDDGSDIPEDIHEHEEISKLVVKLTNKNDATDVQTVNYIGGVADAHLHLHSGDVYNVELDFQIKHDDHYHTADEIIAEKDHHFITYEFADASVNVKRADNDVVRSDGQRLGLKTEWTINSVSATGKVNIKLNHGAVSVDQNFPSATNQQGKSVGGESDVNAMIEVH